MMATDTGGQELRARFNPDGSQLRSIQLRLLDMLLFIDGVCRDNGIEYWLSSGTLLGAVRHGGFIPWDDDVDVEMMPDGLRQFVKAVNERGDGRYAIHSHGNDVNYMYAFPKLRDLGSVIEEDEVVPQPMKYNGCSIDLFTMTPSNSRQLHVAGRRALGFEMTLWRAIAGMPEWLQRPVKKLADVAVRGMVLPVVSALSRPFAGKRLRHRISAPFHFERMRDEIFPLGKVTFEGHEFPAPGNTDAYLRRIYGDYMRLPDPDNIHVHARKITLLQDG